MKTNRIAFAKNLSIAIGLAIPSILALGNVASANESLVRVVKIAQNIVPLQKTCPTGEKSIKGGACFKDLTDERNFMVPVVTPPFGISPVITPPVRTAPVVTPPADRVLPSKPGQTPVIR
jgi:hypothetical protein